MLLALLSILLAVSSYAQIWTPKASIPGNTDEYDSPVYFAANNKLYVGGGIHGVALKEYNPTTNMWVAKADIPGTTYSRFAAASFTINDKGYIGLGSDFNPTTFTYTRKKDMYEYDPATDTYTAKADFPGAPRASMACFVVNNKAYIVGGSDPMGVFDEVWEFDPAADTWTQKQAFPGGNITYASGFSIGTKGYIVLGNVKVGTAPAQPTKKLFEYDPLTDTWTPKADFPGTARYSASAFVSNNKGYVGLGASVANQSSYTHYSDFFAYDPVSGWGTAITNFPAAGRQHACAVALDNKGYVGLGWTFISNSNTYYKDWYEFNTSTGIESINSGKEIVCYPNPAQDAIHIQQPQQAGKVSYALFNAIGLKVLADNLTKDGTISTSELPSGQYFLELSADDVRYYTTQITITP